MEVEVTQKPGLWQAVRRGLAGRCPRCGDSALFSRYLKQVPNCTACGEDFSNIRADDGPAWLTILIVGHVLSIGLLWLVPSSTWPITLTVVVWLIAALVLALLVLPRAKGLFIAVIWRTNCTGAGR